MRKKPLQSLLKKRYNLIVPKRTNKTVSDKALKSVFRAADHLDEAIESVEKEMQQRVRPFRKNALQRFPVIFLLAITFGAVTTEFGLELLLTKYNFLMDRPWLILITGLATLIFTGVAYRKTS